MKPITPCIWYDTQAEEAVDFYVSIFPGSRKGAVTYYGADMPMPKGTVLTVSFELNGRPFMALNGGPQHPHTPAMSLMVPCDDQAQIDHYWDKLSQGGAPNVCGWLSDRWGVQWQVYPALLDEWMASGDPKRIDRMMQAVMQMRKLDLAGMKRAFEGR